MDQEVKLLLDKLHGEDYLSYENLIKHISQFFKVTVLKKNPLDLQQLNQNDIFMALAPNKAWGESGIETVRKYVESGGIFVVLTIDGRKPEHLNHLLEPYGLSIIRGGVYETCLTRSQLEDSQLLEAIESLDMIPVWGFRSTSIVACNEAKVLLQYKDTILAAKRSLGDGTVYLFSCLPLFGNKQLAHLDNRKFLNNLMKSLPKTAPTALLAAITQDEVLSEQENAKTNDKSITKGGVSTEFLGEKQKKANDYLVKAEEQERTGNVRKAVDYCSKALELEPDDAYAWYLKARLFAVLRKQQEVIQCLNTVLKCKLGEIAAGSILALKGGAYYGCKDYAKANECYSEAIEADPAIAATYWHLKALALWNSDRHNDAIACFDKAFELEPDIERRRVHIIGSLESIRKPMWEVSLRNPAWNILRSKTLREYLSKRYNVSYIPSISFASIALHMTCNKYPDSTLGKLLADSLNTLGDRRTIEFLANSENIGQEIHWSNKASVVTPEIVQMASEFAHLMAIQKIWELVPFNNSAFQQILKTLKREDLASSTLPDTYKGIYFSLPRLRREFNFFIMGRTDYNFTRFDPVIENKDCVFREPVSRVPITVPANEARSVCLWDKILLWSQLLAK